MLDKIVEYLVSNGVNAVQFGGDLIAPPYVCVKGERLPNGRGVRFIYHGAKGAMIEIEDGLRKVCSLVTEKQFTSRSGSVNQLGRMIEFTDVAVASDDNTISMEALFLMPTHSF